MVRSHGLASCCSTRSGAPSRLRRAASSTLARARSFAALALLVHAAGCSSEARPVGAIETVGVARQAESTDSFGIGDGRSGALSVTASGTIVNTYAPITATTATTLTVGASKGATHAFAPGDLLLVWRTTGLPGTPVSGSTATVALGSDVGVYEFARVKSVATGASTVLTVTNPLGQASLYASSSQVIRIPEYTTVDVQAGAGIVPYAWDGSSGGAVVFFATGNVTNQGSISADGAGFRGGIVETFASVTASCNARDGSDVAAGCGGDHKGEGLYSPAGFSTATGAGVPSSAYGDGNYANGGGGGDALRSGGGGGSHFGAGGTGGNNTSTATVGGFGGAPVSYDPSTAVIAMGGGGGAGDSQHATATPGAAGGGVVLVRAGAIVGSGTVSANGVSVSATATADGAGGGGAGGAVVLLSPGPVNCGSASANGGNGGSAATGDGAGGGGGGGIVYVESSAQPAACPVAASGGSMGGAGNVAGAGDIGKITASGGIGFGQGSCTPQIVATNKCGGCVLDTDCPTGDVCDPTKNTCGACNATEQGSCTGTTSACLTTGTTDTCTACNGDFGSTATAPCINSALPKCVTSGTAAGTCGTCVTGGDCPSNAAPACSTTTHTCTACNGDLSLIATVTAACSSSIAPFCKPDGTCGSCTADTDCANDPAGPTCDLTTGACGHTCSTDAGCATGQWCDDVAGPGTGVCQARIANGQPLGTACTSALGARACISGACDADNLCGLANGTACSTADGGAAECRSAVCPTTGSNAGKCEPCGGDSDCASTAATPACSSSNQCVACTSTNVTACSGSTPVCNSANNTCVGCNGDLGTKQSETCTSASSPFCLVTGGCGKCSANSDCTGTVHAGPICDTATGACGASCTTSAECSNTQWCTAGDAVGGADAGAGACTAKLADGQALPASPASLSTCSTAVAQEVCVSGVCDAVTNTCGHGRDAGGVDSGPTFDSGFVNPGDSIEGGALSCDIRGGRIPTRSPGVSLALFGLTLAALALVRRKS